MTTALAQNNSATPIRQEAYALLEQLNDANLISVVAFIKDLLDKVNRDDEEQYDLRNKEIAFAELLELRKKFSSLKPKNFEEERLEAMTEKYPFLMEQ